MTYKNHKQEIQNQPADRQQRHLGRHQPRIRRPHALQNRFQTGLDIARYTAKIMRADMAAYDADPANYTQSLGCWHGFIAQQKMISIKKHFGTTKGRYLYLSGWMIARCVQRIRPPARPVDARKDQRSGADRGTLHLPAPGRCRELGMLFRDLDAARAPPAIAPRKQSSTPSRI
jgi:isocitrate lyase